MPSPIPVERFLPRDLSPSIDLRPCSSPLELSRHKPGGLRPAQCRLPPRLAWCRIDWEQVRVLEPLGSGGFGSVYRATYRGQTVALKKVKRCSKNRLASRQSFWAELNAARLCHPHVVRILAASASCPGDPGSPGTVIMEYAGSGTLHRRIYGRGPPLGKACCLRYARHVADGLCFLHRGGVVHLDLKPANVLLAPGDLCKIGDFGCSQRLRDGEDGGEAYNTQLRHLGGTYTHRAPELLRGDPVTVKADIFSFAVTLWQMVTRELPYTGDRQCVLYAVVAYDLRPEIGPTFLSTEEGRAARDIIENCWRARPQDRPNAEELLRTICLLQSSDHEQGPQLDGTSEVQCMEDGEPEVQCMDDEVTDVQGCQLIADGSQPQFLASGASPVKFMDGGASPILCQADGTSKALCINDGASPIHLMANKISQVPFMADGTSKLQECQLMNPETYQLKKCHHIGDGTVELQGCPHMGPGTSELQCMNCPNTPPRTHLQEVLSCT